MARSIINKAVLLSPANLSCSRDFGLRITIKAIDIIISIRIWNFPRHFYFLDAKRWLSYFDYCDISKS